MFTPILNLNRLNWKESQSYKKRWRNLDYKKLSGVLINYISQGKSLDFLEKVYKKYGLENMCDLKGLVVGGINLKPSLKYEFRFYDLSHGYFYNLEFKNIVFDTVYFEFTDFRNCKFINCSFTHNTAFYGCELEKVSFTDCDFLDNAKVENCDLKNVGFKGSFFEKNVFFDCKFDQMTDVNEPRTYSSMVQGKKFKSANLIELYRGIENGFREGNVMDKWRNYYFKKMQAIRKHAVVPWHYKYIFFPVIEELTGYGTKPSQVLLYIFIVFILFSAVFAYNTDLTTGFIISAGAFFTYGTNFLELEKMGQIYIYIFILESFLGISLMATLITVLANYYLSEQ